MKPMGLVPVVAAAAVAVACQPRAITPIVNPMSRWFQFSLRALLMLVVVVAIYSFFAMTIRDDRGPYSRSERRAIRRELNRLADEAQASYARVRRASSKPGDE